MSTHNRFAGDRDRMPLIALAGSADRTIHDAIQRRSILIEVYVIFVGAIAAVTGLDVAQSPLALDLTPLPPLSSLTASEADLEVAGEMLRPLIGADENKITSVKGIYAVGDLARATHRAVANALTAGTASHRALVFG